MPKQSFPRPDGSGILRIHLVLPHVWCCQSASPRSKNWIPTSRTAKESDTGQWFIFRSGLSIARTRLRETTYPSTQRPKTEPNASLCSRQIRPALGSKSMHCTFALETWVAVLCRFFTQISRQSHAGSWSHRWENVVNPCCAGLSEQKSKIGFLKISAVNFHLCTLAEHLTPLALCARKLWAQSLLMFLTLLFVTNMSMYITKPQWIKST